jgi:TetR/AcrR family transcriptional regulator, lmrAB and yxaGH operons repressor
MIRSAVTLFREHGVDGTSFSDVLAHSAAPRGSIYHHFPGGKAQLAEEATRYSGELIAAGLAAGLAQDEPEEAIRGFIARWRELLDRSDFRSGCAVAAATLEGERTPGARNAAGAAFASWQETLAAAFAARGVDEARARSLAALSIAAIEGGILLARAQRSSEPLERIANELALLVAAAAED